LQEQLSETDNQGQQNNQDAEVTVDSQAESTEPFVTPRAPKRAKERRPDESTKLMSDALTVLKTAANNLNTSPSQDEVKSFCAFVMAKMNSYSQDTRKKVQHAIFNILVKADRGFYERAQNMFHSHELPRYSGVPSFETYPMQQSTLQSTPSSSSMPTSRTSRQPKFLSRGQQTDYTTTYPRPHFSAAITQTEPAQHSSHQPVHVAQPQSLQSTSAPSPHYSTSPSPQPSDFCVCTLSDM
jgi:hypothetical protein